MRRLVILALFVGALAGCSSKGVQSVDASSAVKFDASKDGNINMQGGGGMNKGKGAPPADAAGKK